MARLGLSSRAETNLNQVLEVQRFCLLFLHSLDPYQTFRPSSARYTQQNPLDYISIHLVVFDPEETYLPDILPALGFGNDHFFIRHTKCNAIKVQTRVWGVRIRKDTIFLVVRVSTFLRNDIENLNERPLFANVVEKALDHPMWIVTPICNRERNFVHADSLIWKNQ